MCIPQPIKCLSVDFCTMYCFFVLAVGIISLTATAANNEEEIQKCIDYIENVHDCCKNDNLESKFKHESQLKECMLIPNTPGSCERHICFGTKIGFSTADGTIKMDVLEKNLQEKLEDQKELFEVIKKKCINGDFQAYGEQDDCDLRKLANCIKFQVKFRCTDFSEEGSCKGSNDIAAKCLELDS